MAYEERIRLNINANTPQGIYNLVLAETNDQQQAEQAMRLAKEDAKLSSLQGTVL